MHLDLSQYPYICLRQHTTSFFLLIQMLDINLKHFFLNSRLAEERQSSCKR